MGTKEVYLKYKVAVIIKVAPLKAIKADRLKAIRVDLLKTTDAINTKEARASTKERHNRTHILEARHCKLNIRIKGYHSLLEENLC